MSKIVLPLLVYFISCSSYASDCKSFSGTWEGRCWINEREFEYNLEIQQIGCASISLDRGWDAGGGLPPFVFGSRTKVALDLPDYSDNSKLHTNTYTVFAQWIDGSEGSSFQTFVDSTVHKVNLQHRSFSQEKFELSGTVLRTTRQSASSQYQNGEVSQSMHERTCVLERR